MLDSTQNQLSKFRTKYWIEVNDHSRGMYNTNSNIRFKTTMLKASLCHYSDACILFKRRTTITGAGGDDAAKLVDERNKGSIFKNCASFINCKREMNNTEIDNAKGINMVMPM